MHYTASELKKLLRDTQSNKQEDWLDKGIDKAVQKLSDAVHELQKIGIDIKLNLRSGGSPNVFSMGGNGGGNVCYVHGYLTHGNNKRLVGIFTKVSEQDCLQLRMSHFDVGTGVGHGNVFCDEDTVYDFQKEGCLKELQEEILKRVATERLINMNDTQSAFNGVAQRPMRYLSRPSDKFAHKTKKQTKKKTTIKRKR